MKSIIRLCGLLVVILTFIPFNASAQTSDADSTQKAVLITGASTGIGRKITEVFAEKGYYVYAGARKQKDLDALNAIENVQAIKLDVTVQEQIDAAVATVNKGGRGLHGLINNAGVYITPETITPDGLDVRFAVNTIAPYLLTQRLLPLLESSGRVINLSSAAQASVDTEALSGRVRLPDDYEVYAQSKLAITMWSRHMALALKENGPIFIAINPGSLLGTKMVKEGFGVAGKDIRIGAEILLRAALADEFATASGQYFDNDSGRFVSPHPDALDPQKSATTVHAIEAVLAAID